MMMKLKQIFIVGLGSSLFLSFQAQANAPRCARAINNYGESNSARLKALEVDSPARTEWINQNTQRLTTQLKASANLEPIKAWLKTEFDKEKVKKQEKIDDKTTLQMIDRGLGQPIELVLTTKDGKPEVLISSFSDKKNESVHFTNFEISQSKRYVSLQYEENGSLDRFKMIVYDLKERKIINDQISFTDSGEAFWFGDGLFFRNRTGENRNYYVFNAQAPKVEIKPAKPILANSEEFLLIVDNNQMRFLSRSGKSIALEKNGNSRISDILGANKRFVFFEYETPEGEKQIYRLKLPLDQKAASPERIISFESTVMDKVEVVGPTLMVTNHFGKHQGLDVYNEDGTLISKISAPEGTRVLSAKWAKPGETLEVRITSVVQQPTKFNFDVKKQSFELPTEEVRRQMLTVGGHEYDSFYVETVSADGTQIPVRITKRRDLALNGNNPVMMSVYGGFGIANMYPGYNAIFADFLSRGGIVADPGLRGGNEFGERWHDEARQENKPNTFNDLHATARYLVDNGYTSPRKIIIMGGSNGGLTVSAAALRNPQDFGLVIPLNGVQDLLKKEEFDTPYQRGWVPEYGDSTTKEGFAYLQKYSPVELAAQVDGESLPHFLVINGRVDSRVNSIHSFKMTAALLEAHPGKVQMASIKNSGHWSYSIDYQDLIGWWTQSVIWTRIYDHLGWKR